MGRYRTPLPVLLAQAVETVLNRLLAMDPDGAARLAALDQRVLKLALQGPGLDLFFRRDGQRLSVTAESEQPVATTISGSPRALLAMALPDWKTPGSGVHIQGDADAARHFEQLMRHLDPDWDAALAEQLGPLLGHQLALMLRQGRDTLRSLGTVGREQFGAWLGEESGLLVSRQEMRTLAAETDELREAVDRLEARLRRAVR